MSERKAAVLIRLSALPALLLGVAACGPPRRYGPLVRMTGANVCGAQAVYAARDERSLVGYIIGRELTRENGVSAPIINLKVRVDGRELSVWRRESDVLQWYYHRDAIPPGSCMGFGEEPPREYHPSDLEIGIDQPLWRRHWGGWSRSRGWLTTQRRI